VVFVRKKKINNREYHYLVHSTRVGNNKWKKVERYLGINPPSSEEIKEIEFEFNTISLFLRKNQQQLEAIKKKHQTRIKNASADARFAFEEELIIQFTYDTSRIEGSTLSYKDTKLLLQEGITPKDKPIRDIKEAENHKKAYFLMKDHLSNTITKDFILKLHAVLKKDVTEDAGSFRDAQVIVGTLIPIKADMIETEINNLLSWYDQNESQLDPLELAATFHCIFERIHPFFDGNGRVGRLLLNFILLKNKYPLVIIQNKNKRRYYTALHRGDNGNYLYMIKYLYSEMEKQDKKL